MLNFSAANSHEPFEIKAVNDQADQRTLLNTQKQLNIVYSSHHWTLFSEIGLEHSKKKSLKFVRA